MSREPMTGWSRSRTRRRVRRWVWSALFVVVLAGLLSGTAYAMATGGERGGGTITVGVTGGGSSGGRPGRGANGGGEHGGSATGATSCAPSDDTADADGRPLVSCDGSVRCQADALSGAYNGGNPVGGPVPGRWYSVTCSDSATGSSTTEDEWLSSAAAPSTPAVDPRSVALQAESSLRLPSPVLHLNPVAASVVNLATWLWVDAGAWHPYSVTATVGSVSATATATPRSVTWTMGDGGSKTCDGPGTPYDPALPAASQSTSCSYTYARSSFGQPSPDGDPDHAAFTVTATETWSVSWVATGVPGGGSLPDLETSTDTTVRVVQVQSIDERAEVTAGATGRPGGQTS